MADLVTASVVEASGVGVVTMQGPPNNYLNRRVLDAVIRELRELDGDQACGAIVLSAEGKHFCAGRDFRAAREEGDDSASVYRAAGELFGIETPWIAAVHGAAVGAGFGLALAADFRVCASDAYFWPNFVTLGLHHGFGLTATLPRLVGTQRATHMLLRGAKIGADSEYATGLADRIVARDELREEAVGLAAEIARQPARAVHSIRSTMRAGLREEFEAATRHESAEQSRLSDAPTAGVSPNDREIRE